MGETIIIVDENRKMISFVDEEYLSELKREGYFEGDNQYTTFELSRKVNADELSVAKEEDTFLYIDIRKPCINVCRKEQITELPVDSGYVFFFR